MAEIKYFSNPFGTITEAEFKTKVDAYLATIPAGTPIDISDVGSGLVVISGDGILGTGTGITRTPVADVAYDVLPADVLIAYTSLSAGRAVNLPAAAVAGAGRTLIVKDEAAGATAFNISVTPDGTEEIDGVNAAVAIAVDYGFLTLYCDGSNWFTLGKLIA